MTWKQLKKIKTVPKSNRRIWGDSTQKLWKADSLLTSCQNNGQSSRRVYNIVFLQQENRLDINLTEDKWMSAICV